VDPSPLNPEFPKEVIRVEKLLQGSGLLVDRPRSMCRTACRRKRRDLAF
jgi:hypothetical protein